MSQLGVGWKECAPGIHWVEASDTVQCTMPKAALQQQESLAPNVKSAKIKKSHFNQNGSVKPQGCICNVSFSKMYLLMSTDRSYKQ